MAGGGLVAGGQEIGGQAREIGDQDPGIGDQDQAHGGQDRGPGDRGIGVALESGGRELDHSAARPKPNINKPINTGTQIAEPSRLGALRS